MNQQDVEQWIAQNGGAGRVQYSRAATQKDNPAADPITAKAAGVAFDPMAPPKIMENTEQWTAVDDQGKPTGAVLHVKRNPSGDLDVIEQSNPNPTKPSAAARTPSEQAADANATELQRQREKNAALPGPNPNGATEEERRGQDPMYETDAERAARAQKTIDKQGTDARQAQTDADAKAKQADTTEVSSEYVGTGKNRKKIVTYQSGRKVTEDAATNATATAVTYDPDGTKVTKYDDGTETREAKPPTAGQIVKGAGPNGEDMQAVTGPDGKVSYQPIAGAPKQNGMPADLPPFTPDINKAAFGIVEYAQQVNALAAAKNADGTPKLTEAQRVAALTAAHNAATAEASRIDGIRASQQQSQANDVSQRNADLNASVSRGNQAGQATQDAMTTGTKLMSMMSPSSLKGADPIVPGLIGTAYQNAGLWGGLDKPAAVDTSKYPALQALNQLGINPAPPSGADVANQTNATMAQSNNAFSHALGPGGAPDAPQGPLPPIGPSNLFPTPQAPPGTPSPEGMMPDANQPQAPQMDRMPLGGGPPPPGQPPMPTDPSLAQGMTPNWGPMQHPAVGMTAGQVPGGADPQAWQQAVQQASRMLGLG